ncbi:hypothetical protein NLU66_03595 [Brachybacterium sp. NBEC-018]|uniref:phosphotransferase-like protein n=1 Tax=Brachybacterium sp. NBEC-018 TaxID=2996004 RepID=UPI002175353F|nr:hypothetical protein [Brachybacterium sp. NBEC-018]UVY84692.1 hypothetical protein NLU66_03595 [Brachybacterium sp. NBEC-018]
MTLPVRVAVVRGSPRAPHTRIRYGEVGERLLAGMRGAVVAMLDAGNDVILDEMPLDATIVPAWKQALGARDALWIHLGARLDVVEARESTRRHGQHVGNARGHLGIADAEQSDLRIDTSELAPDAVVNRILRSPELRGVPGQGARLSPRCLHAAGGPSRRA